MKLIKLIAFNLSIYIIILALLVILVPIGLIIGASLLLTAMPFLIVKETIDHELSVLDDDFFNSKYKMAVSRPDHTREIGG